MCVNRCCRRARRLPEAVGMHSRSGEPGRPQRETRSQGGWATVLQPTAWRRRLWSKEGRSLLGGHTAPELYLSMGLRSQDGEEESGEEERGEEEHGEEAFLGEGQDCFTSGHPGPGGALRPEPWALLQLLCRLWCPGPWRPWAQAPDEPLSSPVSVSLTAA